MGLLHASLLNTMPEVQLAAVCDKSWVMRKIAKKTLMKILVTNELSDLSNLNLDVIYVTTPIPSHYGIVKKIYEQNLAENVFVEKTLSLNRFQSEELCKLAESSGGHTMVGYMKRFSVTFRKAKELLDKNVLGKLLSFHAYAFSSDFSGVQESRTSTARGGVLEDLGSHVCDLSFWFFEQLLSSVKVLTASDSKADSVWFTVSGSDNFKGKFNISWIEEGYRMPEFGLKIIGTNGSLNVNDNEINYTLDGNHQNKWYRHDLDDHVKFLLGESEYYAESDCFLKSIIDNCTVEPNFKTATQVDSLFDQVRCRTNE